MLLLLYFEERRRKIERRILCVCTFAGFAYHHQLRHVKHFLDLWIDPHLSHWVVTVDRWNGAKNSPLPPSPPTTTTLKKCSPSCFAFAVPPFFRPWNGSLSLSPEMMTAKSGHKTGRARFFIAFTYRVIIIECHFLNLIYFKTFKVKPISMSPSYRNLTQLQCSLLKWPLVKLPSNLIGQFSHIPKDQFASNLPG